MPDDSHLDEKYFIDADRYNCPFCKRRHVTYTLSGIGSFDWTETKTCYLYLVACNSCDCRSLHLSFDEFYHRVSSGYRFDGDELSDEKFFYSVPTSFFTLDARIPVTLRDLFTEAEGCLKSNYLTGASACARKVVFELAEREGAQGSSYEDRLKSLKAKHPDVDGAYFDTLVTIHEATSSKVHENSIDGWESKHLRVILATLQEILHEIYVVPEDKKRRRQAIIDLADEVAPPKKQDGGDSTSTD